MNMERAAESTAVLSSFFSYSCLQIRECQESGGVQRMNERNGFALAFCCVLMIQAGDAGFSV
jgi:hypothetical protein